ncbi:hypothetical protein DERP_001468 [Dermatophagoides pteronyssinus]|uniref:Uncharacterized protein n=1 Tax=Dermatophagoides pteronyssinus TaxID=6956 RepID=A0ABQ8JEI2_DERPT|nr:hypothetical protein DERP_001468 [Dermatophagoides pteronyssinus]
MVAMSQNVCLVQQPTIAVTTTNTVSSSKSPTQSLTTPLSSSLSPINLEFSLSNNPISTTTTIIDYYTKEQWSKFLSSRIILRKQLQLIMMYSTFDV